MRAYLNMVMLLNFLVDLLLLLGAGRLAGLRGEFGRTALAAALGGLYAGACLLPSFSFLGSTPWRIVMLAAMGMLAFGIHTAAFRCTVLFMLLTMAMGGLALGLGSGSLWSLLLAALGVLALCVVGFPGKPGQSYLPVELSRNGKTAHLHALVDTGNTLTDPITGESVLVIGAKAAEKLTGLKPEQLSSPVQTMASGAVAGLRLIPYRAVGQSCGMLLALKFKDVRVGKHCRDTLVAFAPEGLEAGGCQALIGGAV